MIFCRDNIYYDLCWKISDLCSLDIDIWTHWLLTFDYWSPRSLAMLWMEYWFLSCYWLTSFSFHVLDHSSPIVICHWLLTVPNIENWFVPTFIYVVHLLVTSQRFLNWISHDFSQVLWLLIFDVIFNNIPSFDFNSLISHACPRKASQEKKSLPMAKYLGNRKSPIIKKVQAHKTWETTFGHCYI